MDESVSMSCCYCGRLSSQQITWENGKRDANIPKQGTYVRGRIRGGRRKESSKETG